MLSNLCTCPSCKKTFWTCWSKCGIFDQDCKTECVDINQGCLNKCPCSNPTTTIATTITTTRPPTCEEKYKLEIANCKQNCEKIKGLECGKVQIAVYNILYINGLCHLLLIDLYLK